MTTMLLLLLTMAPETIIMTAPVMAKKTWFLGSWCAGARIWFSNSPRLMGMVWFVPGEHCWRCWLRCQQGLGRLKAVQWSSSAGGGNSSIGEQFTSSWTGDRSKIALAIIGTVESWSTSNSKPKSICVYDDDLQYAFKALMNHGSW